MQREGFNYTLVTLLILTALILTGCQMNSPGEMEYLNSEVKKVEQSPQGTLTRGQTAPVSKVVTLYRVKNLKLQGRDILNTFGKIQNGGYQIPYNDGKYKGILKSCAYKVIKENQISYDECEFTVKITYKGTVTLPTSKVAIRYRTEQMTLKGRDILNTFGKIQNGGYQIPYNDGTYKGTLKSVGYKIIKERQISYDECEFTVKITYKGVVKRYSTVQESKVVITHRTEQMTLMGRDILNTFGKIQNGGYQIPYNDGTYKGTLKSAGYKIIKERQISNDKCEFTVKITYKGTVWRK